MKTNCSAGLKSFQKRMTRTVAETTIMNAPRYNKPRKSAPDAAASEMTFFQSTGGRFGLGGATGLGAGAATVAGAGRGVAACATFSITGAASGFGAIAIGALTLKS
jgi:hypothetical protein